MIKLRTMITHKLLGPPNHDELVEDDVIDPEKPKFARPSEVVPELINEVIQFRF